LFFPDTTVVSNFALIGKMSLLKKIVGRNGSWCATVASECAKGAMIPGLERMQEAGAIFGGPLFPDAAEHVDVILLQEQMKQPGDGDTAHLGEAETLTIISRRQLHAAFITDDRAAARQANLHDIPTYTTWHILKLAVATRLMTEAEFFAAYETLVAAGRGHPPCGARDVATWLTDS
jgi:predicted nucleic acid-binding protein